MNNECTIYLIRHGEILSNKDEIYAGWSDEELTEYGCGSAQSLGKEVRDWNIGAIYSSPIRRAQQTAEIINTYLGKELFVEDGLTEIKMGSWEGLRIKDVQARFPEDFSTWQTRPADLIIEGRETLKELQARAVEAVERILEANRGVVLAVTHVAVIRCLQLYYNKEPLNSYKTIDVPNLSVFKISKESTGGLYKMKRAR